MKTDYYSALAPAKVNLFLHVGPVQANGRHPLDSLVMFAGEAAADRLSVMISDDLSMTITGPGMTNPDHIGPVDDNLVLRAARALKAETGTSRAPPSPWRNISPSPPASGAVLPTLPRRCAC
jgi:4-diphosphocytidyl-2-C-methyl-D-erythritol kinase